MHAKQTCVCRACVCVCVRVVYMHFSILGPLTFVGALVKPVQAFDDGVMEFDVQLARGSGKVWGGGQGLVEVEDDLWVDDGEWRVRAC
jgi:hypothetical protein